jgi:FkbM family methyltransferase
MLNRIKQRLKRIVYGEPASWREEVPRAILHHVPNDRALCLVDIGAHDGDFTRAFASKFKVARALMIEALPHKAANLRIEFKLPKYTVTECAVSELTGLVDFEVNEAEQTSSLLKIHRQLPELSEVQLGTPTTLTVQTRTLDDITLEARISEIDLLKIDVQGAEGKVLVGASQMLNRTRFIWVEVSFKPLYENSPTFFDIYAQMDAAGFGLLELTPEFRAPNREVLQADGLFFRR